MIILREAALPSLGALLGKLEHQLDLGYIRRLTILQVIHERHGVPIPGVVGMGSRQHTQKPVADILFLSRVVP